MFNKLYGLLSYIIGFAVSMPLYLAKTFALGTVTQTSSAYNSVSAAFSILMDSFNHLAEWRAVIHRLAELSRSMRLTEQENDK